MTKISVVIPTYNRAELLSHTLTSLEAQTLDKSAFEIIVVDDGGQDHSESVVESFSHRINVKYFWQEDNGFRAGKARNIGTAIAQGKYIVYVDTGVLLATTTLEEHLRQHESAAHPIAIIGYVYGFDLDEEGVKKMNTVIDAHDVDSILFELQQQKAFDIRQHQYDDMGENISHWPAPFDLFWTCHVSAERSELLKVGMFDEDFNTWGGEDVDLGVRLFMANNQFVMKKEICSFHWPHPKEVNNHDDHSNDAAQRIHQKYNLWQTSYYNIDHREDGVPLNKIIQLYREQPQRTVGV
ncbi:glycosyltransferase [Thaumasiovibrio subtropicus]|uniref:glycosyltransferase n=1 Tax=Thaumasiovibrio subtropicus TaxID=1891207 RepID=UPI000B3514A7|nr:glycosyltransferase [Thaumasiovibrio subtropicus]